MIKRIAAFISLALGSALALGQHSYPVPRQVEVQGYTLHLHTTEGQCILVFSGQGHEGRVTLGVPAPCEFLRHKRGDPQFYRYKEVGDATVLMVVGGPVDNSRVDDWMKEGCGTQVQAVMLRSDSVIASKDKSEISRRSPKSTKYKVAPLCPSDQVDETMFWVLSHPARGEPE